MPTIGVWMSLQNKLYIFGFYGSYKIVYEVWPGASYTYAVPLHMRLEQVNPKNPPKKK